MFASHKMTVQPFTSKQPQRGVRTERAMRWLVILGFSLVSLVALANWEHQQKQAQMTSGFSAGPVILDAKH